MYVDSYWASERSNSRRSLSGGVLFVDGTPVKAYTRQQTSPANSSAEAELTAMGRLRVVCIDSACVWACRGSGCQE